MAKSITAYKLRQHWINQHEIALLDVREEGPFAESHPLFAISVPVSEIETKLPALVPRLSAPIVVYDDGEDYAERATARVLALGYRDVAVLEGGLSAYARVGEVYRDVNVPSKAFGELVESIKHTPSRSAREVKGVLEEGEGEGAVAVLDARRFSEYNMMSIPRGRSCPGGELLYRFFEAVPSPQTTVVVNCAGRTRSIIGTQSLINAGVPNKVIALRNGTIGWTIEGLELDTKKTDRVSQPSAEASRRARAYATSWAEHVGVTFIDGTQLGRFAAESEDRTLYLLDVRDPEEYALGHPAGFSNAPGGQLVQATDEWVGVRGARLVLYDTDGVRAPMTASWLLQLGWEVYVFDERSIVPERLLPVSKNPPWAPPKLGAITIADFQTLTGATTTTVIDLARSPAYRKGHIPGAWFASGPELARDLRAAPPGDGPIVLTSPDGSVAAMNIEDARRSVSREVLYLVGGTAAWVGAGQPLETEERWLSSPIDVYKRPYEGTGNAREAMQGYLDWEYGLVAQLANDGVACFHVVR
ncbi:Rhodanese-like domain-containing protein [Aspergillus varians]